MSDSSDIPSTSTRISDENAYVAMDVRMIIVCTKVLTAFMHTFLFFLYWCNVCRNQFKRYFAAFGKEIQMIMKEFAKQVLQFIKFRLRTLGVLRCSR